MKLKIDRTLKQFIPPLLPDERELLEASIAADGCRDPIVTWNEIVIDGHNRYEICTRLKIPFKTVSKTFPNRDAVMEWMDENQLGRRNLTNDQRAILRGRVYNRTKKTHGAEPGTKRVKSQNGTLQDTASTLAAKHGVERKTIIRDGKKAEVFAKLSETNPEAASAIMAGKKKLVEVEREQKEKNRENRRKINRSKISKVSDPSKSGAVYSTIVIDPPWDWGDEGDKDQLGRARPDYATMTIEELAALDVGKLADTDSHLYLWITNRSLPKGFRLLEAWGFRYITAITWVKPHFGMGNYFRGQTEHVLFGVKGSQPLKRKDAGTVFNADRGKAGHSSKPESFLPFVESCSPGPYLEMFSRSERKGWSTWGENANG